MDLNIEGVGEVAGWSPPIGEVMTPGFKATLEALRYTHGYDFTNKEWTRRFITELESKGYCIAKYDKG